MKIEKLTTNCYRVRKTINKKTFSLMFDHEPSDVDIAIALAEKCNTIDPKSVKQSMDVCFTEYLTLKKAVLSPSTHSSYNSYVKMVSDAFKSIDINDLTQIDVQLEINRLTAKYAPKTVLNIHGFFSAVIGTFRPTLILSTSLPQKIKYEAYVPKNDEVKMILDNVSSKYSVAYQLGVLGMRRSEVCALELTDVYSDNNDYFIKIDKAKVRNDEYKWVIKKLTKTENGKRTVQIPKMLYDQIMDQGYIYKGSPAVLRNHLRKMQKDLGLPDFRFHDMRVYYASYAHACGVPDAVIMYNCGWKSEYTMKSIYRKAMSDEIQYFQKALASDILNIK